MYLKPTRDFYDVASLAKAFNMNEKVILDMAASGEIPARKMGDKYLFSSLALHEWLGAQQVCVPHGEPTPEFKARIARQIERYGPLLGRLAK